MTTIADGKSRHDLKHPMVSSADEHAYDTTARALHWLVFGLLAAQVAIGWSMPHIRPGVAQEGLVAWHLSVGAAAMLVVLVRLAWRIARPTPLAPMVRWERVLATLTHLLLYLLLIVIPVLGWAAAGFFGYTVRLFGFITLPALADHTMRWAHEAGDIHDLLTNVLLGVVGLHVLAALWHYFIRGDRVLQRMLPGVR
jgi:cytochrome b561